EWLTRRIPVLERLNIPAPIAGGLVYAVAIALMRGRVVNFEFDLTLRDFLMIAFFTTIGLEASFGLLKDAGRLGGVFLLLATAGAVLQNVLGAGVVMLFGLDPLLGVISGSAALTGGPATALAFGPTFEKLGVAAASTVGLACATFGITIAGLLGGFVGGRMIRRHKLKADAVLPVHGHDHDTHHTALLPNAVAVAAAMGIGSLISAAIERAGVVLPAYIGAMLAAAAIRNMDDRFGMLRLSNRHISMMGNVALSFFVVMALLGLRLWELANLALPVAAALAAQVALVWVLCLLTFRVMGRDYEAAVMSAGYCGFMLGTTASALASMHELERQHGPAPQAFIVVPVIGAFLIDFTNALVITAAMNLMR
ncbi:MAG TPA: sodium/glutamate symporter, partial [Bryobacteraceae bacterium]|nr:sodium/glutamate symporter [Bryobacteraceae bacterium]